VWIDYKDLVLSRPLVPQLTRAILGSHIFCLLDSPSARRPPWVRLELQIQSTVGNQLTIYSDGASDIDGFVRTVATKPGETYIASVK
jgi:hypothetical protein